MYRKPQVFFLISGICLAVILFAGFPWFQEIIHKPENVNRGKQSETGNDNGFISRNRSVNASSQNTLLKRLPGVHILGAIKSGTTTLQVFLPLHPDIVKSNLSATSYVEALTKGNAWFKSLMPLTRRGQVTLVGKGGFCGAVRYNISRALYQVNPDMKIILILRDPVERAISHFTMFHEFEKWRNITFEDAIVLESNRSKINKNAHMIQFSLYYECLLPFLQVFSMDQMLFLDSVAFVKDPLPELAKIETHLGIPHLLNSSSFYFSETRGFYCYKAGGRERCLPKTKGKPHVPVTKELKDKMKTFFQPYNEQFFELINRRFNW